MVRGSRKKGEDPPESTNSSASASAEPDDQTAGPSGVTSNTRRAQQLSLLEDSGLVSVFILVFFRGAPRSPGSS